MAEDQVTKGAKRAIDRLVMIVGLPGTVTTVIGWSRGIDLGNILLITGLVSFVLLVVVANLQVASPVERLVDRLIPEEGWWAGVTAAVFLGVLLLAVVAGVCVGIFGVIFTLFGDTSLHVNEGKYEYSPDDLGLGWLLAIAGVSTKVAGGWVIAMAVVGLVVTAFEHQPARDKKA
jgi:hypothetical protein